MTYAPRGGPAGSETPAEALTNTAREARGAYPVDLVPEQEPLPTGTTGGYRGVSYTPELHLLDAEWFFTPRTSRALAELLGDSDICLLGSPTVANELPTGRYTLVDQSPFVLQRFPRISAADVIATTIDRTTRVPASARVLLDPPWYWPALADWLAVAFEALGGSGRLCLPLLGEGTRPTAAHDRRAILAILASAGRVEVLHDFVEYDVPLFEARALEAAGIQLSGPWRRADLAVVEVEQLSVVPETPRPAGPAEEWSTFVIGAQVVKLRADPAPRTSAGPTIGTVPGVEGLVLDSVSRRDPRCAAVDLWTSRNLVGQVSDRPFVARLLGALEGPSDGLPERVRKVLVEDTADITLLLRLLELLDD
ncbi:hypothetical protein [Streptomyces sp. SID13031]|uniref:hypothetical protein n=1 Tax=Streptomyces sp. SID13031 TaxID=2706046 RepID=UPI0013CBD5F6|nr:hypothetical protein [Streptomyces sp. SID13031]NEA32643.1 hypothetical protein [Streptomyces sp. SID13031]